MINKDAKGKTKKKELKQQKDLPTHCLDNVANTWLICLRKKHLDKQK
jgi:hypothetical protein